MHVRKVPVREKKKKMIGKRFFDKGDYKPGRKKKTTDFKSGEFLVLCYQPGTPSHYWCERCSGDNPVGGKRDIQEFGIKYVEKLVLTYEKE